MTSEEKQVWVCGIILDYPIWGLVGVYDSLEKAVKACLSSKYFVGPVVMNYYGEIAPPCWEGAYYPLAEKE